MLDPDLVSAFCPSCRILLAEASSNSCNDLAAAVDLAASRSAVVATSSWTVLFVRGVLALARAPE